ncbi:MAG TPA: hypothetical protein VMD75_09810, partial [Candidatus Binataceae bacterium]|nr:hypothetical protein [Candidatus Binataceae bacterium]
QLERWRDDWGIFSPDDIARMAEVELTSEFMLLIFNSILDKDAKTITAYYKKFDPVFDDGFEVARRFRATFDQIADSFDGKTIKKLFKRRAAFFALFASIYGLQYGLRASKPIDEIIPLQKRAKPTPLKSNIVQHMKTAGAVMAERTNLPDDVMAALRGATSDVGPRKTVIRFLVGKENDPCRHLS